MKKGITIFAYNNRRFEKVDMTLKQFSDYVNAGNKWIEITVDYDGMIGSEEKGKYLLNVDRIDFVREENIYK